MAGSAKIAALIASLVLALAVLPVRAESLPATIAKIKPAIVGVGSYMPTRQPRSRLFGTGFVVTDGYHVVTNAHVVGLVAQFEATERLVIFAGSGMQSEVREVRVLQRDDAHDLALLRIQGTSLPTLELGDSDTVLEGKQYAFTGFPIGVVLGLYPATHRGIVSSITPIAIPADRSGQLDARMISQLRNPFTVFQLDATAYPGNSGSPLYDPATGLVVGVINKVFVKTTKEAALEDPSGITYAIPAKYVAELLRQALEPAP